MTLCLITRSVDEEKGIYKPGLSIVWKIVLFQRVVKEGGFPQFNIITPKWLIFLPLLLLFSRYEFGITYF